MSDAVAGPVREAGYGPALALRHLWRGASAPRAAMREALDVGIGEGARLSAFALFVLGLGAIDPETRGLARAAIENTLDDSSRLHGLLLLGLGGTIVAVALLAAYWTAAVAAQMLCGRGRTRPGLARMRSVVALSAWFSLLPTAAVKVLAMAILPATMVAADPPSLFSAIEAVMVMPYFAACLVAACGIGLARAVLGATIVNGAFYLLVVILYFLAPSP